MTTPARTSPQLTLPFAHAADVSAASYLPLAAHQPALAALQNIDFSTENLATPQLVGLRVYGAACTGKTHLLQAWAAARQLPYFTPASLPQTPLPAAWVLDDIAALSIAQQTHLFHWYNAHVGQPRLLVFASIAGDLADITLPDLRSRLLTFPAIEIGLPTPADARLLLLKWAEDRQIKLADAVMDYILTRTDRAPAQLHALLQAFDAQSLAKKRGLTVPVLKEVLAALP